MPTLTGTLKDVTGVELLPAMIRQMFVKAPQHRPSLASGDVLIVSAPVDLGASGSLSVDLEPGPAVLVVQTHNGAHDTYELHVTSDMTLLSEAVAESAPERSWSESVMVQLRTEAVDAAVRAETAAGAVDEAIAGAAGQVVAAVEDDRARAEVARAGAESARDTAEGHASAAAGSESAVAVSASAAAGSASAASSSATAAGASESAASGHAGAAATSAGEASDSADAAASSASQSAGFRDAAEGHAIAAGGSADAAAGSATAAAGSATSAEADADRADAAAATAQSYRWVPQGDWVAGPYEAGDVVVYDGASYYAGSATSAEPPGAPWVVLAAGGGISDASELSGALTDQVDASAAMVTFDSGEGYGPRPESLASSVEVAVQTLGYLMEEVLPGLAASDHTHTVSDIEATGTRSATTYLNGTGEFSTPPNTTYTAVTTAAIDAGTEDVARLTTASRTRHAVQRWVTGSGATPVTAIGQALAAAATAASARATIGAVAASGTAVTLWSGTQTQYNALPTATRNAAGFIAVIT